jgi:hypothetical protein
MRALGITVLVLTSSLVFAEIRPNTDSQTLPQLFDSAALVLRGTVISVKKVKETEDVRSGRKIVLAGYAAEVQSERVYKGQLSGNALIVTFYRPEGTFCAVSFCESMDVGEYDLFFLSVADRENHLLNKHIGKFLISRLGTQKESSGFQALTADLVAGLQDPDETALLNSLDLIGSTQQQTFAAAVRPLLSSPDMTIGLAARLALLRLHQYADIYDLARYLESPSEQTTARELQERTYSHVGILREPGSIPFLLRSSESKDRRLRGEAIYALREIANPMSVPVFVNALDDPEQAIRYDAVLGLASVEHNWDLAPSFEKFQREEPKYVSAWKNWWEQEGKSRYQK